MRAVIRAGMVLGVGYALYAALAVWAHTQFIYPFAQGGFDRSGYTEVVHDGALFYVGDGEGEIVLFFMGNGGALRLFEPIFATHEAAGRRVVALQYPGGGGVDGEVSEDILKAQALVVYDWIVGEGAGITVHGYSLGTSLAQYVASEREVSAVILDAPFVRMCEIMSRRSWLPACWLPGVQTWDSAAYADKITAPILIQHGQNDGLIPVTDGQRLSEILESSGAVVRFEVVPDANHGTLPLAAGYAETIAGFLVSQ